MPPASPEREEEMSKLLSKWYTSGTFVSFSNNYMGLQLNLQSLEVSVCLSAN